MVYEIKRLNVWSVAKVSFVLGGMLGVIAGIFLWMFTGLLAQFPMAELSDTEGLGELGSMGAMMPLFMGVIYAFMLMIVNSIMAGVYNLMGGLVGGIELTLVQPATETPVQTWTAPAAVPPPPPPPAPSASNWTQTPPPPPPPPPAAPGT